jgi:hypothetical protein
MVEFENKKQRAGLVEDCFRISTSDLGKRILYPNGSNRIYLQHKQSENIAGKAGAVAVASGLVIMEVNYRVYFDDPLRVEIFFGLSGQTIFLDTTELQFGTNVYFLCPCERRCRILYMKRGGKSRFACRDCHNLRYELTTFSNSSELGIFSKLLHNYYKMDEKKLGINRVDYNGQLTRKAKSMIELSKKITTPTI